MLTPDAAKKALEDVLDPEKVSIYCAEHMYFGPLNIKFGSADMWKGMPHSGCAKCWKVFFIVDIARTPPSERQARVDELEAVVTKCCELADQGKWDFQPFDRPTISITTDSN
jgi:hypothetical protein